MQIINADQLQVAHKPRLEYLDVLRVLATFAVVLDHYAIQKWYGGPANLGSTWTALNFYECVAHWAVPVFVMISGVLFLGRDLSIRRIWRKYIARIVCAFLFWTIMYGFIEYAKGYSYELIISHLFTGQMHMWYLFMICGMYAITPLVRPIAQSKRLSKYFLILAVMLVFLPYQIIYVCQEAGWSIATFQTMVGQLCFSFAGGYTAYYLLGHLLNDRLAPKSRFYIYLLGILGLAVTIAGTTWLTLKTGEIKIQFLDYLTPNLFLMALAVFVFVRHGVARLPAGVRHLASRLSPYCFGIYLVHPIVIGYLETLGINSLGWQGILTNAWINVPATAILVFAVCTLITLVVRNLPFIGKQIT